MKKLFYKLIRLAIKPFCRPKHFGSIPYLADTHVVYVLPHRSIFDLISLDILATKLSLARPVEDSSSQNQEIAPRTLYLFRGSLFTKVRPNFTDDLEAYFKLTKPEAKTIAFVPCTVFWGRSLGFEKTKLSMRRAHWSHPGIRKKLNNLFLPWGDIWIHLGEPIYLGNLIKTEEISSVSQRRLARLLRSTIQSQKTTTLGPNFENRDELLDSITTSNTVKESMTNRPDQSAALPRKIADSIASNMSYPTIRALTFLLNWFWNRIYEGIELTGIERVNAVSKTHSLIYVPCHRSHVDYLLLSFLLFHKGLMIPHIAAGDNLNIPILGRILRQGGAFFMRRSFSGDELYSNVFKEYLYQTCNRGHSIEFFPEGGRSRTGKLLSPKLGFLNMCVESHERGLSKPVAFIPVYIGYEKIIEGATYVSEMKGARKTTERLRDILVNLKLIKQNFGKVQVNIGQVLKLDKWREESSKSPNQPSTDLLARKIMNSINDAATVNAVNLTALVLLGTARQSLDEETLKEQLGLYINLTKSLYEKEKITNDVVDANSVVQRLISLGLLKIDLEEFGQVFYLEPFTAVLMTWYQNNVIHLFCLPSLIANLIANRRLPIKKRKLLEILALILPYMEKELSTQFELIDAEKALSFLIEKDLIELSGDAIKPPNRSKPSFRNLKLISRIMSPTVERMFIILDLIVQKKHKANTITHAAKNIGQKIGRLYGINSPDFYDLSLFDNFFKELNRRKAITISDEGAITANNLISDIVRHAEGVISTEIRQAINQEASPR